MADFTLFRGRVTHPAVTNMGGGATRVALQCEDYNALFDEINVGAPDGGIITQDDGTELQIDSYAIAGTFLGIFAHYWIGQAPVALVGPDVDDTYVIAGDPVTDNPLQWYTLLGKLRQALDDMAAHVSGATRYWIDPDGRVHWVELIGSDVLVPGDGTFLENITAQFGMGFPVPDPDSIVMAPFSIGPVNSGTQIMPMENALDWDYTHVRRRAFVRGATVPGSGWNGPNDLFSYYGAGEDYIDASGSIYEADKNAISMWWGQQNFRSLASGHSMISPGYDGWRVGQMLPVTDPVLARFAAGSPGDLIEQPFLIRQVTGTLKAGGDPIGVRIGVVDVTTMVAVQSFTWNEVLGETGTASLSMELLNDEQGANLPTPTLFSVPPVCDIELYIPDGTNPTIEYTLDWGDVAPGAISRQLAKVPPPPAASVVYHFIVEVKDPGMPDGASSAVSAQFSDSGNAAVRLSGVPMEWVLLQWEDTAETSPGTAYELTDDVGVTDQAGTAFNTLTRTGAVTAEYHYQVVALALPIV